VSGPLAGVTIADFTRILAGPYATMLMADLGATVIKIEHPAHGDDTRTWLPPTAPDGTATYYAAVNRNKQSVALDLDQPADLERAQAIAQQADILIENFPSGSLERRALGYRDVADVNPGIIYCTISGFGSEADLPGYDLLVQAMGGLMDITGHDEPTKVGVAVVDVLAGLHATTAILAALHERVTSGRGQHIEITLLGALLSGLVNQSSAAAITGQSPQRMGNAHPSITPYEVFPTADRPLVIAVGNDQQFTRMCQVLGHPEWATDERFTTNMARNAHRDELRALMVTALATSGVAAWQQQLTRARVPCGPVNTVLEALHLAEDLGLQPVVDVHGSRQIANPATFSRTPVEYRSPPPRLGEHNSTVT
jgi:crotonobetainyl-CoA:carnitine CoA-transferase CaiB-like acyl-CoA transferase